jgi:hypothetical protein
MSDISRGKTGKIRNELKPSNQLQTIVILKTLNYSADNKLKPQDFLCVFERFY